MQLELSSCFLFCILAGVVIAGKAVVVVQAVLAVVHLAGASVVGVGLDSSSNAITQHKCKYNSITHSWKTGPQGCWTDG